MHTESPGRQFVEQLDREFATLIEELAQFVRTVRRDLLYATPPGMTGTSVGENVLRSAAAAEQTFGGLTSNLWDDPFEWTLPENLSDADLIIQYLGEVDDARRRTFGSLDDDRVLLKYIAVPSGETRPLVSLLLETLMTCSRYQGSAVVTYKIFSAVDASGFII